jgi:hypothetical protein
MRATGAGGMAGTFGIRTGGGSGIVVAGRAGAAGGVNACEATSSARAERTVASSPISRSNAASTCATVRRCIDMPAFQWG